MAMVARACRATASPTPDIQARSGESSRSAGGSEVLEQSDEGAAG
jgi:hypothetical protein